MLLHPLHAAQKAAEALDGAIHRDFLSWLGKLTNAVNWWLVPPKTIITVALTATDISGLFDATGLGVRSGPYDGWAICNGNNGTPDLDGKFLRISSVESGGIGGQDSSQHTHTITHDHGSFTSDDESSHTHGAGTIRPRIHADASNTYYDFVSEGDDWTSDYRDASGVSSSAAYTGNERIVTDGTSDPGDAHSHTIDVPSYVGDSGFATSTENRPAYYELVALMRTERTI